MQCLFPTPSPLTSVLRRQSQRRAAPSPHGEFELSEFCRRASSVDGDSCRPRSQIPDALIQLCRLAADNRQHQICSASVRRLCRALGGGGRWHATAAHDVTADLKCGNFQETHVALPPNRFSDSTFSRVARLSHRPDIVLQRIQSASDSS